MAQRHNLDETTSLARVAQQVGRGGYRREFTVFLREQLQGASPQPFHQRIVALVREHGIKTLITTAYDDLLKRAFDDAGVPVEVVWKDSQLAVAFQDRPLLIQLYGNPLTDVESLIVTEDDHLDLWRDRSRENVLDEVKRALQRNTVLFLGYDLSDPDFLLLWREVLSCAGDLHRRAFAVWPGLPEAEVGVWADRGIVILEEDPWGLLNNTEDQICARLPLKTQTEGLRQKSTQPMSTSADSVKTYHGVAKAWAVLVGINRYDDPYLASLKVCVDDVTAIHQALAGHYQAARLLTDATPDHLPTRANILGELSTVAQAADADDLLLFYFSGHGMAEGGESYLLARDTRLSALKHTAVAMQDIREIIEQSPAHAKVIMLDACHSGASIGKAEPTMTPEFIRRVFEEAEGMAVLASCKQGQQSWEWQAEHRSVFTYYLLEALSGEADLDRKGFVTVADVSRYVTDGVKAWSVDRGVPQTPTLQYTVAGDIILVRYGGEG